MGIDRIGKGGPTLPTSTPAEVAKSGQSFEATLAEKAEKASKIAPVEGAAASPLEKLHAGQLDVNGYLDLKIEQAIAPLKGLGASELDAIKKVLREQLATDPTLSALVKGAAGAAAPPLPEG